MLNSARDLPAFEQLSISTPEGFAYYALHPLAYADVIQQISACDRLLVVGIRSIGTTLSAVAAACCTGARNSWLRGSRCVRRDILTIAPPNLLPSRWLRSAKRCPCGASFAVVDEGPGLSGSSFLAVAEALERAGAPTEKIILISSHAPNVDALCAENAACRWQRFRCIPVARRSASASGSSRVYRRRPVAEPSVARSESEWPAAWTSFERLKYLSSGGHDERRLFKFAGLGHYGDVVFERERKVAAAGFGPMPREESDGFVSYPCD